MATAPPRSLPRLRAPGLGLPLLLLAVSCGYDRPTEPRPGGKLDVGTTSAGFLHDNFTGADGTLLENHIPDGEGDPFRWFRGGNPTFDHSAMILGDGLVPAEDDAPIYTYFADAGGNFNVVEADIEITEPVTHEHEVDLYIQATPESGYLGDGWLVRAFIMREGETSFHLYRGGCSEDASFPQVDWSPGIHHLRFEIVGGQVANFYVDGDLVLSGDPICGELPPSGAVGIGGFRSQDGPAQVKITSFTARESRQQSVNVVCLPNNPVRGDSIHCKTALAVPERYTVLRRTARGVGFIVEDSPNTTHEAGDTNSWDGIAVAGSDVTVEVQVGTGSTAQDLTNSTPATFGVQARPWPSWQLTQLFGPNKTVVAAKNMLDYPLLNTNLGLFIPDYPNPAGLALNRPSGGPNSGLVYLPQPVLVTGYLVVTHPALYPPTQTTPMGSKKWYKDQNVKGSGNPLPAYCSSTAQIATLAANVERHEGVTKVMKSHFGVANQQFALLQPQQIFEELYTQDTDVQFRADVDTAIAKFNDTGPYAAAQQAFENQDTGPTLASAGCTFDFNPNDN